jgi:hypothetical protein
MKSTEVKEPGAIIPISEIAPYRLGIAGIGKLAWISEDTALKIQRKPPPDWGLVPGKAEQCVRILFRKAKEGDATAARALHEHVEWATSALNSLVDPETPLWKDILSSANGWPVVYSDTVDEKKRANGILEHVGSSSILNIVHHYSPGTKPPRYTQDDKLTEISIWMGGALLHLRGIARNLTVDFPSSRKFTRRLDAVLSYAPPKVPTNGIRTMIEKFRGSPGFCPQAQLADWVVIWLEIETGGHLELVSELRERCINANAVDQGGKKLNQLVKHAKGHGSDPTNRQSGAAKTKTEVKRVKAPDFDPTDEDVAAFLKKQIGTPAAESTIRATITARLLNTNAWVNRENWNSDFP